MRIVAIQSVGVIRAHSEDDSASWAMLASGSIRALAELSVAAS
jgi:hypothetical protein